MLKPKLWVPHLAALATVLLCARLAFWQLDRADEKRERMDLWQSAPTLSLNRDPSVPMFATVQVTGKFDPMRHVLLDNQVRNNHPGVHVFTPFRVDGSTSVYMVNRGWLPWDRSTDRRGDFETDATPVTITARLSDVPKVGLQLGEASALDPDQWPNLMTYYDTDLIRQALGAEVAEEVLLLDPQDPAHLTGDEWRPVNMGAERHVGYAFQWTAIGTAVLLIWLVLTYRSFRKS